MNNFNAPPRENNSNEITAPLIKKLRHIEDRFKFLIEHICDDFIEVNLNTGESFMTHSKDSSVSKGSFKDQITCFANTIIIPEERARYLAEYDLDTLVASLRKNKGVHTSNYTANYEGQRHHLFIFSALMRNDPNDEHIFSYTQDITETLSLQKEKQYGDSLTSNYRLTFEANITQNLVISYDLRWADEMSLKEVGRYSDLIDYFCEHVIAPEYIPVLKGYLSPEALFSAHATGKNLFVFECRKRVKSGNYEWFEHTVNLIKEQLTGDIIVRNYVVNINLRKEKEFKALEEQRFYEIMLSKSATVYEVNVSKDIALSGHENWSSLFGIQNSPHYTEMIHMFCTKALHPDDQANFCSLFSRENILNAYARGKTELSCDYRRPDENNEFIWVRCTMHTFEEPFSGDIRGFSYVEKIDIEKKKELSLIYKSQHDSLTGLYNKSTVDEKISAFFDTIQAQKEMHAFFIIDLDYFKAINDNFGHAYGDAVLSQIAAKISSLFRPSDILGRIGGDEFIVLMKNIKKDSVISLKAMEICRRLQEVYTQKGIEHKITASIGIATYPLHGSRYSELYHHSDTALYDAKAHGRNRFSIYHKKMQVTGESTIKAIDHNQVTEIKKFEENILDYLFRILYESSNKESDILPVLELIGKYYALNRVYIFEDASNKKTTSNTFEWCDKNVTPQMKQFQNISYQDYGDYKANFNEEGLFFIPDLHLASKKIKPILAPDGVKSMLQVSILKNDSFIGFIGFDHGDHLVVPSQTDLNLYQNIANILSVFLIKLRALEELTQAKQTAMSIVNALDSYAYVCDPKTYELLFINHKTLSLFPHTKVGDTCYRSFWKHETPCKHCPMDTLLNDHKSKFTTEIYSTTFDLWAKITVLWIDWLDQKKACLLDSVDITAYKKAALHP